LHSIGGGGGEGGAAERGGEGEEQQEQVFMAHSYEHDLTQLIFKRTKIKMSVHTFLTSALDQDERKVSSQQDAPAASPPQTEPMIPTVWEAE
jgi:hypothetical protein